MIAPGEIRPIQETDAAAFYGARRASRAGA